MIYYETEVVSVGRGVVVPSGRVQTVQPEHDGTIAQIMVTNGSVVEAGQTLVVLDSTILAVDVDLANRRLNQSKAEQLLWKYIENAHLSKYQKNLSQSLKNDLKRNFADYDYEALVSFFNAWVESGIQQKRLYEGDLTVLSSETNISLKRLEETDAQINAAKLIYNRTKTLYDKKIVTREKFEQDEQALIILRAARKTLQSQIALSQNKVTSRQNIEHHANKDKLVEIRSKLSELKTHIKEHENALTAATRRLNAATIISPISGIVDQMSVFTVGGVISAGTEIMRIVPTDNTLIVESIFQNTDVGFIQTGQKAIIKFDAFSFALFGHANGQVYKISADSVEVDQTPNSQRGYLIEIELASHQFGPTDNLINIVPGMTGQIEIITKKRKLITYFFAPIVETIGNAMGER